MGKNAGGDTTIDMPVTRLCNIEDGAEIKEKPAAGDYIPVMDMADGGQMKKFPYTPAEGSGTAEEHRYYEKDVTLCDGSNVTIELNILADISVMTVNGKKRRVAQGRIKIKSFTVQKNYSKTFTILESSDNGIGSVTYNVPLIWGGQTSGGVVTLIIAFTELTDGDIPFKILNSEIYKPTVLNSSDKTYGTKNYFPFWLESNV